MEESNQAVLIDLPAVKQEAGPLQPNPLLEAEKNKADSNAQSSAITG
jgi:hypothetical protein